MIALDTQVTVNEDVVFTVVDDEAVLLDQKSGQYFGLDNVGTHMWSLLTEHGQLAPVYEAFLAKYDVNEEQLEQDLIQFVDELVERELLLVVETEQ